MKNINTQNLIQSSSFGLSLGTAGSVFTNNVDLRNLAKESEIFEDELNEDNLSDFLPENLPQKEYQSLLVIHEALKKKRKVLGGLCTSSNGSSQT